MYPYINLRWEKLYMTGVGIVIAFLTFLIVSIYLTKRYHQNFWKLFYWMPILIVLCYFLGSYVQFFFDYWALPANWAQFLVLLSPYGYKFHFVWILIGLLISIRIFLRKIKRIENKKIRVDILFFSLTLAIVPLWIFLLLGDNFIWATTNSFLWIKSLHSESQRNKFNLVMPIWLFLSIGAIIVVGYIRIFKKKFGRGLLWFGLMLLVIALVLLLQQYPRHGVLSLLWVKFDIKQYAAILVAVLCFLIYRKRNKSEGE